MFTDYSIEYCHIYSNEEVGPEHAISLNFLDQLRAELDQSTKSYTLCVMLDNYTFPERIFDKSKFLSWLESHDHTPDVFINEGDLIPAADEVVSMVSPKRARELKKYIEAKRYPCSLFIATWYLARLGKLRKHPSEINTYARGLINILPERFVPFEDEAREIILDTPYADVAKNIKNQYFRGMTHPETDESQVHGLRA